ncbi:MAG TPA: PRC-barrel domain-containing protein [Gammaproteobacteria bacterium]|nr:PRC-barrel domain-containing protein [Gammaproteobacteria bacterium]
MKSLKNQALAILFSMSLTVCPLMAQAATSSANGSQSGNGATNEKDGASSAADQKSGKSANAKSDSGSATRSDKGDTYIRSQQHGQLLSGELTGVAVQDSNGDELGDVENVLIDRKQGIRALVVGVGGFLGIGTKSVAVNFDKFQLSRDESGAMKLVFQASKDELTKAPTFKTMQQKKSEEQARKQQQKAQQQMKQQQSGTTGTTTGTGGAQ